MRPVVRKHCHLILSCMPYHAAASAAWYPLRNQREKGIQSTVESFKKCNNSMKAQTNQNGHRTSRLLNKNPSAKNLMRLSPSNKCLILWQCIPNRHQDRTICENQCKGLCLPILALSFALWQGQSARMRITVAMWHISMLPRTIGGIKSGHISLLWPNFY